MTIGLLRLIAVFLLLSFAGGCAVRTAAGVAGSAVKTGVGVAGDAAEAGVDAATPEGGKKEKDENETR